MKMKLQNMPPFAKVLNQKHLFYNRNALNLNSLRIDKYIKCIGHLLIHKRAHKMKILILVTILIGLSCTRNNQASETRGQCIVKYNSKELTKNSDTIRNPQVPLNDVIDEIKAINRIGIVFKYFENDVVVLKLNEDKVFQDTLSTNWSTSIARIFDLKFDKQRDNILNIKINNVSCDLNLPTEYLKVDISFIRDSIMVDFNNHIEVYE
jgi:hypothetical protein